MIKRLIHHKSVLMALNSFICDWCFTTFIQSSLLRLWFLTNLKCCAPVLSRSFSSTPAPEERPRPAQEDGEDTLVCWPPRAPLHNTGASRTGRMSGGGCFSVFHFFTTATYIPHSPQWLCNPQGTQTAVW